jgi:hypothetical protein
MAMPTDIDARLRRLVQHLSRPQPFSTASTSSAAPDKASTLFEADFESGDLSQFGATMKDGTVSDVSKNMREGSIEVVTDIVHSGRFAGKFTIFPENVFNAQQLRTQVTV